ncbi:MAG: DUF1080 domain-containing protein [Planctomycetes bacterium]|nr:DUF1080 domain-containing protein [Planctomycetota bacterium]
MKRKTILSFICAALCIGISLASAADKNVQKILDKMPAESSAAGVKLIAELAKMGPDAIKDVCKMLVPPGTGDDSKARYALNGLAMYCSRPGAEAERKMYAAVLIDALKNAFDGETKAFLIRQLQLVGKDDAVPTLSGYLNDERLCNPAVEALLAIRTSAATQAMVKALPAAKGKRALTLIRALAQCRAKEAADAIKPYATSQDTDTRRAALYALANIGCASAAGTLAKAAGAKSPFERARATSYYLLLARRLAEAGNKDQCAKICRNLLQKRKESNVQCAALKTLMTAVGKAALPDLLKALDSKKKDVREAALQLVCALPGGDVTAKCVEKMKGAPPVVRVEIIGMLGRRGDKSALPALIESLKDQDKAVKLAAIPAVARLGGDDAVPALVALLQTDQADEIKAAKEALQRLPGEKVLAAMAEAVPTVPPKSRVALLEALSKRRAKAHVEVAFTATKDEDSAVRRAAIKALGDIASPEHLPRLIDLMITTKSSSERKAARDAIASVAKRIPDPEKRAEALLAALPKANTEQRGVLLAAMARVGGTKALATVLADTKSQDEKLQDAAIRALADWKDIAAAPEILKIAQTSDKLAHQVLALRGYTRLAREIKYPSERELRSSEEARETKKTAEEQKLAMFKHVLDAAKRPDEIKLALAGLADVETMGSAVVVGKYLDDDAVKNEAALALVRIVVPRHRRDKGISDPIVQPALKKAVPLIKNERIRTQAEEHLRTIPLPDAMNLAWRKPVKVSENAKQEATHKPEFAVDGNFKDPSGSAWWARGWPCWIEVDLQQTAKIDSAHVWFYWDGTRYYQYKIETSLDGKEWKTVVDQSKNTTPGTARGVVHEFAPTDARYVRCNILKNSSNPSIHLVEFKVYAQGTAPKPPPPPKPDKEGFVPLFNGKDLTGWTGSTKGYYVKDGVLICDPKKGGLLKTEKMYSDFIFRFEFKLPPGGNNGVSIRYPGKGGGSYAGMEIQILDNTAKKYAHLHPYQYHGSIYGIVPAKRGFLKPVGEWNSEEIKAQGPHITVMLNGTVITDADLSKIAKPMDGKEHPGMRRTEGYIGFMGHGDQVEFRNIKIKELK